MVVLKLRYRVEGQMFSAAQNAMPKLDSLDQFNQVVTEELFSKL